MALTNLEQHLNDQPLAFFGSNAFWPNVGTAGVDTTGNQKVPQFTSNPVPNHPELEAFRTYNVAGNKILLAKLATLGKTMTGGDDPTSGYTLQLSLPGDVNAANYGDYLKVWFLPWKSQCATKMQLSPPLPTPRGGPVVAQLDAHLFVTAALSGCSMFVEGSQRRPIIYHLGYEHNVSDDLMNANDVSVEAYWRRVFNDLRTTAGQFGEVNKSHYVNDGAVVYSLKPVGFGGHGEAKIKMVKTPSGTTQHVLDYTRFLKKENKNRIKIEEVKARGSVIGIRDDNLDWTFYYQEIVTIDYWQVQKRTFGKDNLIGLTTKMPLSVTRPMTLHKFWPGTGHVQMLPYFNVLG